jgi:hypothetical protein
MNILRVAWSFLIGVIAISIPYFTGVLLIRIINPDKSIEWWMFIPVWIIGLFIDIIIGMIGKLCYGIGEEITGGKY